MEENKIVIDCYDKEGNIHKYRLLDLVNYEGKEYAVAIKDGENNVNVEIFDLKHSDDRSATLYTPLNNEYIFHQIYTLFKYDYKKTGDTLINFEGDEDYDDSDLLD